MYVSKRFGLAFIHIPKTAGTSIAAALAAIDPHGQKKLEGQPTSHQTAKAIRAALGAETYDRLLSFAVVRNPFDRACSLYHFLHHQKHYAARMTEIASFSEFIKLYRVKNSWLHGLQSSRQQTEFILGDDGTQLVRRVLRFENLAVEFNEIAHEIGVDIRLPVEKASGWNGRDYRNMYDEETRSIVAERFSGDLENFGYSF
jgi:hypothetical protein